MASYFNKGNRQNHFLSLILWDKLDNWVNKPNQLEKEEQRCIRMAITYIRKASNSICQRMGRDYTDKLHRDMNGSDLMLASKGVNTGADSATVPEETLDTIANYALLICQRGHYCPKVDHHSCELHKALWEANIPVAVLDTDGCPYKLDLEEEAYYKEKGVANDDNRTEA